MLFFKSGKWFENVFAYSMCGGLKSYRIPFNFTSLLLISLKAALFFYDRVLKNVSILHF